MGGIVEAKTPQLGQQKGISQSETVQQDLVLNDTKINLDKIIFYSFFYSILFDQKFNKN